MKIVVVDRKKNEVIKVNIDINDKMFIVAPEIINNRFNYLRQRLMDIRKVYMIQYLEDKENYAYYEGCIYKEMKEMLMEEMSNIYKAEGIMFYTM